ncbi:ABC transporter permease [Corynebacterium pacaense]|uniref:ABC transporter permease n=1 Tax=Corynebacterium pacaense TaxID=1816684 RepID=UPI0009BBE98C|nr:ABC transporter permease [Corynebacterium pacaense]
MTLLKNRPAAALREKMGGTGSRRARKPVWFQLTLVLSAAWILLIVAWLAFPGWFASADPLFGDTSQKLLPPSGEHLFGTDKLGRDLYARVVHGTRLSILAASIAVGVGLLIGVFVGLASGFFGGRVDDVLMRLIDVLLSVPSILLALTIVAVLGNGTVNVAIAIGVTSTASFARLIRSEVMRIRHSAFIEAAYVSGTRWYAVVLRHILPHAWSTVLALLVIDFGRAILAVSTLSFLGFGAQPPTPEWGALISDGRNFLLTAWWLTTIPGVVIVLLVLSINRVANAIRSARS